MEQQAHKPQGFWGKGDTPQYRDLLELWGDGLDCTEIATALTKKYGVPVSRVAVITKARRTGLERAPGVMAAIRARAARAGATTSRAHRPVRVGRPPVAQPQVPPPPKRAADTALPATACTLEERPHHGCRWVLNVKRDGEWLFCGAPAKARGPEGLFVLCDEHAYSDGTPGMLNPSMPASVKRLMRSAGRIR